MEWTRGATSLWKELELFKKTIHREDSRTERRGGSLETGSRELNKLSFDSLPALECSSIVLRLQFQMQLYDERSYLLHEESEGIKPWQQHVSNSRLHPLLLELERLRSHHRRVDEVQSKCVRSMGIDDGHGVFYTINRRAAGKGCGGETDKPSGARVRELLRSLALIGKLFPMPRKVPQMKLDHSSNFLDL